MSSKKQYTRSGVQRSPFTTEVKFRSNPRLSYKSFSITKFRFAPSNRNFVNDAKFRDAANFRFGLD